MAKSNKIFEPAYRLVGQRVRWAREQRGWSAKVVAEKLQLHQSTVSQLELGRVRMGVADLVLFAAALGVDPSVFLRGITPEQCWPSAEEMAARRDRGQQLRAAAAAKKKRGK